MSISMMYLFCFILVCIQSAVLAASAAQDRGGCDYDGRSVQSGTTVWQDPECECTQLICLGNKVELVEKGKPCCNFHGKIYGNGETIKGGQCQETVCNEGKPLSVPKCPKHFEPIVYNDCVGCYNVSTYKMAYKDAGSYCEQIESTPVQITSEEEANALEWFLFEKHYKNGITSYWTGGYAEVLQSQQQQQARATALAPASDWYLSPFYWPDLHGIPVEAIYDDWCPHQPSSDTNLPKLQLSYYDYGHYCWCNENPEKLNHVICEMCTQEKPYQMECSYKGKVYGHKEIIDSESQTPGPCFKLICYYGKLVKKHVACDNEVWIYNK